MLASARRCFQNGGCGPSSSQDTVQIGNQLPGLKMRSIVVGGVSEDKVSVRHGFRGCMQVGRSSWPRLTLTRGRRHHTGCHWATC